MKQKILSWGDDFTIRDENGNDVFFVDGKAFSIGKKLSFQDMSGRELAFIKERVLSWGPTYEITRDGRLAAMVKKRLFTLFKARFTVDVPGPDDLEAEGDLLDHEYAFRRGYQEVATVSKKWFSWSDSYGIEISDDEDEVLILAAAVVIDMVSHSDDD